MDILKNRALRVLLQMALVGICAYQLKYAFSMYLSKPIINIKSEISLSEVKKLPKLYICKDDQFDYQAAKNLGYRQS